MLAISTVGVRSNKLYASNHSLVPSYANNNPNGNMASLLAGDVMSKMAS